MILASTTVRRLHDISARHASTGEPIAIRARLEPTAPHGWHLRVRGAHAIVIGRSGVTPPPALPTVHLTVADRRRALSLATQEADVALTAVDLVHEFQPIDMVLTVALFTRSGDPRTGRTVRARATSGPNPRPTVALTETDSGVYRSAATRWTAQFHPFDLMVNNRLLRKLAIDFTKRETRVRLVDTT